MVLVWLLAAARSDPPTPVSADAAGERQLSADRVLEHVTWLDPKQTPHPVGSIAHARVRERLRARMRAVGLEPEVQASWACRPGAACAPIHNVLARIPGRREGPAVMVAAHYDSVHAGVGAGDDLHGVGILLEIGRMLAAGDRPDNPVILLVTDAEEVGLLGARAFVREHPLASEVAVVVNVEARGTSGRSNMFETSEGNAALIDALHEVPSPSATSLAYEVYRRMPNDTDLTVFKDAGMAGLNFAFVGDVNHYHTPLDDLRHLSPASVQHLGESAWAVTRALAEADLASLQTEADAAYLDVLGLLLLQAPTSSILPVCIVLLLGTVAAIIVLHRRKATTGRTVARGLLGALGVLVVSVAVVAAVDAVIGALASSTNPWPADPIPRRTALLLGVAVSFELVLRPIARRVGSLGMIGGVWLLWSVLGVTVAVLLPGAAPFLALPTAAGLLALLLVAFVRPSGARDFVVLVLPLVVTAILWLPLAMGLEQSLGFAVAVAAMLPYAMVATTLAPDRVAMLILSPPRRWPLAVAGLALAGLVYGAARVDAYDEDHPRRLVVEHHTNVDTGEGQLRVGPATEPLPVSMQTAAEFGPAGDGRITLGGSAFTAPAPALQVAPPELEVLQDRRGTQGRDLQLRIVSPRGADRAVLLWPAETELRFVEVEGQRIDPAELPARWQGRRGLVIFGLPPDGARVQLASSQEAPDAIELELTDVSGQLSDEAEALAEVRPPWAETSQWADTTSMTRRYSL